jgi:hypothetical protein
MLKSTLIASAAATELVNRGVRVVVTWNSPMMIVTRFATHVPRSQSLCELTTIASATESRMWS